jgi:hypothetical protein
MRKASIRGRLALLLGAILASPVMSQPVSAPTLEALTVIEAGQWQLRADDGSDSRSICVADPRILLQVRHRQATCSRFIIANEAKSATIHYTCPGAGHGRTTLRVETPRLVQIESQGIADNAPFAVHMEARRTGSCTPPTALTRRLPYTAKRSSVLSFK